MSNKLEHLGVILDGNRRWAENREKEKIKGHNEGLKNFKQRVLDISKIEEIDYLTAYTLSTENFKNRSEYELKHLFSLMEDLLDYTDEFLDHNIKLKTIGDLTKIPQQPRQALEKLKEKTKDRTELTLTLAINYGGRDEIVRAVRKIKKLELDSDEINEEKFDSLLDSNHLPAMDLLVRTGGHKRISNFLLWNMAYSELYFTDTLWPDFSKNELYEAIEYFHDVKRKFGA